MNGPGEVAGFAFFKAVGFKVGIGMIGAALLYFVLPPVKVSADGKKEFNEKEFVLRLATAGVFSSLFGDMAVQQIMSYLPGLRMDEHAGVAYLMTGAPAWWITRAVALWFQRREGQDIVELAHDVKDAVK